MSKMSAFEWHTSLVRTLPTPSNEPCERSMHLDGLTSALNAKSAANSASRVPNRNQRFLDLSRAIQSSLASTVEKHRKTFRYLYRDMTKLRSSAPWSLIPRNAVAIQPTLMKQRRCSEITLPLASQRSTYWSMDSCKAHLEDRLPMFWGIGRGLGVSPEKVARIFERTYWITHPHGYTLYNPYFW